MKKTSRMKSSRKRRKGGPHPPQTIPEAACQSLRVELARLVTQLQAAKDINSVKSLMKEIVVVEAALQKCPGATEPEPTQPTYPDLSAWLAQHPAIASAIKWQITPASMVNGYLPPTNANKIAWPNWSSSQKADLTQVYLDTCIWFDAGAVQVSMNPNGLTDEPVNVHPNVGNNNVTVMQWVTPAYMWDLYLAHVGFSLAAEITNRLPWSITGYNDEELRYLFDSTTMAWMNIYSSAYSMGSYGAFPPALRADNLPKTAFAPPKWTYPFLKTAGLIGSTRLNSIGKVFDWMRQNLWHFYGADVFSNCFAIWQYLGYPPLSKIINGTIDMNNLSLGRRHWTLGCHGSVGFLNAILRIMNIPVQPIWVCGHEMACFLTESKYLDHGDDPYSQNVVNSQQPSLSLLIDEPTYQTRFSNDLLVNPTIPAACNYVGYQAYNFPP